MSDPMSQTEQALKLVNLSGFWRGMLLSPVALVVTFGLFLGLSYLTTPDRTSVLQSEANPHFDFLLVRKDSQVESRVREKPEMPEEIPQPEMKPLKQSVNIEKIAVDEMPLDIETSAVAIDVQLSMSPALANLGSVSGELGNVGMTMPFDASPTVLRRSSPRYPSRALRKKIQGYVVVEFIVNEEGRVKEDTVKVVESEPAGVFEKSVLRSIKRWKFKPKKSSGQPIAYRARQKLEFRLDK